MSEDKELKEAADKVYKSWNLFSSKWRGVRAVKNPCDAWIYQELIWDLRPDFIIETGTYMSGGSQFLATMLDMVGNGRVLTIENEEGNEVHWKQHPRITYFRGSSLDPEIIERVKNHISPTDKVMVVLDSDHHKDHVARELETYSPLVTKGQYLIVEDTWWMPDSETYQAVKEFMENATDWMVDKECERFRITNNPGGFLKRL